MSQNRAQDLRHVSRMLGSWRVALQLPPNNRILYGVAKDMSPGGMSFFANESVPQGLSCTAHFLLPPPKPELPQLQISVSVKILYSVFAGGGEFRHGIEFGDFAASGKLQLAQYLAGHGY